MLSIYNVQDFRCVPEKRFMWVHSFPILLYQTTADMDRRMLKWIMQGSEWVSAKLPSLWGSGGESVCSPHHLGPPASFAKGPLWLHQALPHLSTLNLIPSAKSLLLHKVTE